jgi:hypothetical protein
LRLDFDVPAVAELSFPASLLAALSDFELFFDFLLDDFVALESGD